ncbi:MAG: FimV family protein [Gammaproteobacteria bacterium]|nr:FimV family protein [Gammaproteobacteria bacterium]
MVRKFLLVFCLATTSTTLMALGLGEIKLKSGLNQPLDAEIVMISVRGESNEQLIGSLGSNIDFERSGIDRLFFLTKIRFQTITKPNGQKVLHLSTKEAVKEPILNFLVKLEWPSGRLLREYTLFLDPPIFDDAPEAMVTPAVTDVRTVTPAPAPAPTRNQTTTSINVVEKSQWEGEVYGPTSKTDTLWGIASKVRPDRSISMQQAMVTIFEANPDAFKRGNINNLKRGAEIRVPDSETFNQIPQREALKMIAAHNESWKSGKRPAPRVVMDTSNEDTYSRPSEKTTTDSGRLSLSADDSEIGSGGSSASDIIYEEENEVLKHENEMLQQQYQTDAERIANLERLLELKSEQLAMIQDRNEIVAAEESDTVETSEVAEQTLTTIAKEEKVSAPIEEITPAPMQPKTEKSIVDGVMDGSYNLYLIIAGSVILLLIIISIFRRRSQDITYQNDERVTFNQSEAGSSVSQVSDDLAEAADDVLAGKESEELEKIDNGGITDSADPLGEADIYIAYGKFDQAESLLISAIENNPERMELSIKLLECYAEMDAKEKFEQLVVAITDNIDSDYELRNNIEDLYQTAWPEDELFSVKLQQEDDINEEPELADDSSNDEVADDDSDATDADDDSDATDADDEDTIALIDDLEELPSTEDVFGDDEVEDEYEFGDDSVQEDEENDVETQLDLARAYIEMGDKEGTREIIAEIMEIGTDKQREEAQKILDSLN